MASTVRRAHPLREVVDLEPGDHVCCLYQTEPEHRVLSTRFLRQGLERGDRALYIASEHTPEVILGCLQADGIEIERHLASGQMSILTADDTYVRDGTLPPDEMIDLLRTETELSLAQGYSGLRVASEMAWALREPPESERLIEYESRLDAFLPGSKCLVLCQYDLRRFDPALLTSVLATHPSVVVGTEIYHNFCYLPPSESVGPETKAAALRRCLRNLSGRKKTEEALRETSEAFRALVQASPLAIVEVDSDGNVRMWNPAAERIFGWCEADVLGGPLPSIPAEHWDKFRALCARLMQGHSFTSMEVLGRKRDGSHIDISLSTAPLYDAIGHVSGAMAIIGDITDRKQAEDLLKTLSSSSPIGVYVVQGGKFQFVNQQFRKQTGYGEDELIGTDSLDLVLPEDRGMVKENAGKMLKGKRSSPYEYRVVYKGGETRWIIETVAPIQYRGSRATLGNFMDVTERKRMEEALRHSLDETAHNQRLLLALSHAAQAVHHAATLDEVYKTALDEVVSIGCHAAILRLTDDREHLAISHMTFQSCLVRAAEKLTGLSERSFRLPLVPDSFSQRIVAGEETIFREPISEVIAEALPTALRPMAGRVADMLGIEQVIGAPLLVDGKAYGLLAVFGSGLSDADVPAISVFSNQIAIAIEKALLIQRTYELAITDGLTGLYNHRYFQELLAVEVKRANRYRRSVTLLMVDIDRFKAINDSCGHQAGDGVLRLLAGLLRSAVRDADQVARYGGEEFAIILPETSEEESIALAERVRQMVEDYEFKIGSRQVRLTVSIGVAPYSIEGKETTDELIQSADSAMYEAKRQGGNMVLTHTPSGGDRRSDA